MVKGWGASVSPKLSVGSKGASRLSGPWDGSVWREEEGGGNGCGAGVGENGKKARGTSVRVSEKEIMEV